MTTSVRVPTSPVEPSGELPPLKAAQPAPFLSRRAVVRRSVAERLENGLQTHLRVVHGYTFTRLAAFSVTQLAVRHQRLHKGEIQ